MEKISKKVCILGSTGSIGCNSLEVIDNLNINGNDIAVEYLSANTRIDILANQVKKYSPRAVVIQSISAFEDFKSKYSFPNLKLFSGKKGLLETASTGDYDLLINALVGFSGLEPTIEAIKAGKDVALANKETLVVAGAIINELTDKYKVKLLPIDSEHSAILQCLIGEDKKSVSRIILTASGGPFLKKSIDEIRNTTVEEALDHPNWKMGNKITIDSATMMNKGLEVIEAKWLFNINPENIDVLIHPQSIIHSMVEFKDGSVKAQLGIPDMKIPIQYAITFPLRINSDYEKMDFKKNNTFTFDEPDLKKFRCLQIAYDVLKNGGTYPVVLNAANEIAVDLFLNGKIKFLEIADIIEHQLSIHKGLQKFDIEEIIEINDFTRQQIQSQYKVESPV